MAQIYVIPAEGLLVPDPAAIGSSEQVRLPAEGKLVEDTNYWQRRLRHGDVTIRAAAPEPVKNALRSKDGDK
jgi:hypothetical protein